jgi:REP element-mobilizing transposase RayT
MPRRPRIEGAGLIHHVTGHSLAGHDAFLDDAACRGFLSLLAKTTVAFAWHVLAYSLLPNHHHLLVQTDEPNLGLGMRRLHGLHAARLNERLGWNGHLWRDRFHSRVVDSDRYTIRAAIYIDLNPVEAGLCMSPRDWRWSSYRANAGFVEPPFWHSVEHLYQHLGAAPADAAAVYREAVALESRILGERKRGPAASGA